MIPQPPPGYIHLVLLPQEDSFYLEIPIAIVDALCLSPRKYLLFIGWCVLGVKGDLTDEEKNKISLDGKLLDQGIYEYSVPGQNTLDHAVDLQVIQQRSQIISASDDSSDEFLDKTLERDGCCVWTGLEEITMHIIPYARGSEACLHYS